MQLAAATSEIAFDLLSSVMSGCKVESWSLGFTQYRVWKMGILYCSGELKTELVKRGAKVL